MYGIRIARLEGWEQQGKNCLETMANYEQRGK